MSDDWKDLDEESGEKVVSNRFSRMLKIGTMGAKVGASSLASKLKSKFGGGSEEEREDALKRAHAKNAEYMADVLGRLKGASMKIGQILSADPELLPEEFSDGLESLQRDAPPMTYETVKSQIEEGLGRPLETIFARFDPEPVGSASIGQVHRGRLESGEEVAVKVQYPGVVDSLESDLKSLRSMLVYGRAVIDKDRLDDYFEECRDILRTEADYEQEADALERFREVFAEKEGIRVPKPFKEWSSSSVLVMEYVDGEKLDHALERLGASERRDQILKRWVETYVWMFHEHMELHADPHPGNFLLDDDDNLVILDFGCTKTFEPEFADGILEILDCCWLDDQERAIEVYFDIGFGTKGSEDADLDPDLLWEYHNIILEPFLYDKPFSFGGWKPAKEGKKFMLSHPSFLKLVPPKDAVLYFRVLSGIKGLLGKCDAELNMYRIARETARRRGVLTDDW